MYKRVLLKSTLFLLACVMLASFAPYITLAATTADITVTATPTYVAITNTPATYGLGVIAAGSTHTGNTSYFTINNSGSVASNISMLVTAANWTGGVGWIHSNTATAGADTVGVKFGSQDDGNVTANILKTTAMDLVTGLAAANHTHWGLTVYAPTSFGDGELKTATIRLTIVQA